MPKLISIHEYDLKPEVNTTAFERAIRDAESRDLLRLPGLVAHHLVKGVKGARSGAYAAIWVYESQQAWEQIWGPPDHPRSSPQYPENWKVWEGEVLAPFLIQDPDAIRFTTYVEV
jgi:hypothetical protein